MKTDKLNGRCKSSFHCSRCFQPNNNRNYFIFIEHTPFCYSKKCDIPCVAQKREAQQTMSVLLVQRIIVEIAVSRYNVVLYGLGSSDFPYHELIIPQRNSFQTTITNSYRNYSKNKPERLLLYARVYSLRDVEEVVSCSNFDGIKIIVCNKSGNDEYIKMAKLADKNKLSLVFDYDHISENTSKLEKILQSIDKGVNITRRGNCDGTKPIVITHWTNLSVTYREEFHYFDTTKTVSKSEFLKHIL